MRLTIEFQDREPNSIELANGLIQLANNAGTFTVQIDGGPKPIDVQPADDPELLTQAIDWEDSAADHEGATGEA
jgi:hypothetical protein